MVLDKLVQFLFHVSVISTVFQQNLLMDAETTHLVWKSNVFPRNQFDDVDKTRGLDIVIIVTTTSCEESRN